MAEENEKIALAKAAYQAATQGVEFETFMTLFYEAKQRATGRSTRLADEAIQTLFTKGFVVIRDHYNNSGAHHYLYNIVVSRLKAEHNLTWFHSTFDKYEFTITFNKEAKR